MINVFFGEHSSLFVQMLLFFEFFICISIGYACGSIPFGVIYSKLFKLKDPRKTGSKNIGATNVLRSGHKLAAFLTLVSDALKGLLPIYFVSLIYTPSLLTYEVDILLGACLGHMFPYTLKFKGGKAVATFLGGSLLIPFIGIKSCLIWLISAFVTRYSSLSSIIACTTSVAFLASYTYYPEILIICGLIIFKHKENIKRLIEKTEPKIGHKAK